MFDKQLRLTPIELFDCLIHCIAHRIQCFDYINK